MTDTFVGNNIVGNFKPEEQPNGKIETYKINKINGILHIQGETEDIILSPLDNNARLVVNNFSGEIGEFNESIYKIESNGGLIIVVLYVYSSVQKLLGTQSISIYMGRDMEQQICRDGLSGFRLSNEEEIVPFLTEKFINNKSIFASFDPKNKNKFQIFGNKCRANIIVDRSGVYKIDRIYKTYDKEFSFSLTQIYGNIRFVLWKEAIEIKENPSIKLDSVKTPDVFKAWNEYMDFERRLYEEELKEKGLIKYSQISVKGDELVFQLEKSLEERDVSGIEFEFLSSFSGDKVCTLPNTVDGLIGIKQERDAGTVFLGKCHNDGNFTDKLIFGIPYKGFMDEMKSVGGLLYVSDHSLNVEQARRKKVLTVIESKKNESSNIIMKLSASDVVDTEMGSTYNPINEDVLKKMFGNPNVEITETYREAMSIALNTPDIALIQGPPGTGKTTLIKGIIARLNMMSENYRILVSSEQHEALGNVVNKLAQNKFIPPFVSSRRFDTDNNDDNERFGNNVKRFQENFIQICNNILRNSKTKSRRSYLIADVVYLIQTIRSNNYNREYISSVMDKLKEKLIGLGFYSELDDIFSKLNSKIKRLSFAISADDYDANTKAIIRKINAQRIDISVFLEDDGVSQLKSLQSLLKNNGYDSFLLEEQLFEKLISYDINKVTSCFEQYIKYVNSLAKQFIPHEANEFEDQELSYEELIEQIAIKVAILSKNTQKDFYEIVESLSFRLNDLDLSSEIIKKYTTVIGSTCAQAQKSLDMVNLKNDKYNYVIIDEAARANPLDIMIPMMMGVRVILIGDHKQLPHYIESNYVNRFKNEKDKYSDFDENLLTKSLFQIIYENLELAYKEGRIRFKRTIRIDEQHRMHPTIGDFISRTFYDGGIKNGAETVNNRNDYNMFEGKNVVWINVPNYKGTEQRIGESLRREAEVTKIIEIVRQLVEKNPGRRLKLGIISFYKGQVERIRTKIKESFPQDIFDSDDMCNTVDSYQGKEFDIVIVSGVRSNNYATIGKSLGFIQYSPSRINVALSRAKKVLVVVADENTYHQNDYFRKYIEYVKENGYYEDR